MRGAPFILFADAAGWRLSRGDGSTAAVSDPVAPADGPAAVLAEVLRAAGYSGAPVLLGLPSDMFLCAPVLVADLPARRRAQAMLYRLEERLPVSAEDVVAEFICGDHDATALGVCVQRRALQRLLDVANAAGVSIGAICPTSLLALQELLATHDPGDSAGVLSQMVIWSDAGRVEIFRLDRGPLLRDWSVVPDNAEDVGLHVGMTAFSGAAPTRVLACGLGPEVLKRVRETNPGEVIETRPLPVYALAASRGRAVVAGKCPSWVDLAPAHAGSTASGRTLTAVRRPLAWVAACAAILVVAVIAALFARGARYERLAASYEAQQQNIFRQAFPGQKLPRDVRSRLASEEQRLRTAVGRAGGAGGAGASRQVQAQTASAGLLVLRDVIAALPADLPFRVNELRLEPGRFVLQGEARTHGDAEAIAEALRNAAGLAGSGFEVEPPRTELRVLDQVIVFTLTGVAATPAVAAASQADSPDGGAQ